VTFANLARKKAAKEQIVLIPEWQNIVNTLESHFATLGVGFVLL